MSVRLYLPCDCKYKPAISLNSLAQSLVWTDSAGNTGVYSPGDIAWVLASTALVWIMIPGIGFFYSGFLRCVKMENSTVRNLVKFIME